VRRRAGQLADQAGDRGQRQIDQRRVEKDVVSVGRGLDPDFGDLHNFHHRDRRDLRGVLDNRDALVGQGRDHPRDHLRQNDHCVERPPAHAEGAAGFELAGADRLEPAAVYLGDIAAVLCAQSQQTRGEA